MSDENILEWELPDYISEKNAKRFFDFIKKVESETYPETPIPYHNDITEKSIPDFLSKFKDKNIRILDIGCGQGPALKIFKENRIDAVGITLNDEDVSICRSKGFEVYKMDQSFLEFKEEEFDGIWARHVLEHSFMPYFTLNEYRRILKQDGILYIEVPAVDTIFKHETNPNHYSILTENMWFNLLHKSGFEILETKQWKLDFNEKSDFYYVFFAKKTDKPKKTAKPQKLYLALSKGENFGWGVCSKYLNSEVPKIFGNTLCWDFSKDTEDNFKVDGKVFHALTGIEFESISKIRGNENYGYTFFENELTEASVKNSKNYDLVIGGSSWNKEKLIEKGITNASFLIQGIDPELFYPESPKNDSELFVIFSGGKFELRKGQDIVLKAVKILQQKYPNIVLINAWYNMWPQTMEMMEYSKHIKFELKGNSFTEKMHHLYKLNGIDSAGIITNEIIPNTSLRQIYCTTDIGLFPNRCEGGTNLVMMEYMACGKPVVASFNTGHKDILNESNSLPLKEMQPLRLYSKQNELWADWFEPSVDEVIEKIEWAYNNKQELLEKGKKAGEDLKNFTWQNSAKKLLEIIGIQ